MRTSNNKLYLALGMALTSTLFTGCGGSGGTNTSNTNTVTPPVTPTPAVPDTTSPTWQAGQFSPSSQFAHRCEAPRTGTDPFENTPYPDVAGTMMHEKMWLRSFSYETYLWYDEIIDNDPSDFTTVAAYFAQLKTFQKTASGKDKDQFHFSESYEDYKKESQDGVSASFGLAWTIPQSRMAYVAYVNDNTPAANAGVQRGDRLLKVGDLDFATFNGRDNEQYNQILTAFTPRQNQVVTLTLLDRNGQEKVVTMTAQDLELKPVKNTHILEHAGKQVGYVQFNQFTASAQSGLIDAFRQFSQNNIDELILDMRYNGGGIVIQASQLSYMIAGSQTNGRNFSIKTHNIKQSSKNEPLGFIEQSVNWTTLRLNNDQLPSPQMERVYILATGDTASASESVINALRGIDVEVILIGDDTRGKPFGFVPEQNCGTVYYTIQNKSANAKGFGDYEDGFIVTPQTSIVGEIGLDARVPGCRLDDDFSKELGDNSERLFAGALHHIATGNCPEPERQGRTSYSQSVTVPNTMNDAAPFTLPFQPLKHGAVYTDIKMDK
ncbi:S41 family peptidase [Pseudoalteromonas luteoviolacea]|uniref:S41 family peptidase n=1 Tax=Pseudoalteromonas luteoviolacea TaxID=43657 RepID=UPI001EEDAB81|nr:S41 family peptidase [Pseudoalteromonas luteoviolacea]MCF6441533.1 S41 family peptidase [Pseudoalteromonas luteoviolacea]